MNDQNPGVARAIRTIGSQVAVAAIFPDQLAQSTISEWLTLKRPVPPERAVLIEQETRRIAQEKHDPSLVVRCEELNASFPWNVLRAQATPAIAGA